MHFAVFGHVGLTPVIKLVVVEPSHRAQTLSGPLCVLGVAWSEQCSQAVTSQKGSNGLLPMASQNGETVVLDQGAYRSRSLSEESLEYAVGYDYSGITQCQLDEKEGAHSEGQMQVVECEWSPTPSSCGFASMRAHFI